MSKCTIVISATGERCGAPAVKTFESVMCPGEILGECREHFFDFEPYGQNVGDIISVHRHGKEYTGQVVKVTPSNVYAEVTYDNGRTRVVRV